MGDRVKIKHGDYAGAVGTIKMIDAPYIQVALDDPASPGHDLTFFANRFELI